MGEGSRHIVPSTAPAPFRNAQALAPSPLHNTLLAVGPCGIAGSTVLCHYES
jgi:hypothetical protein